MRKEQKQGTAPDLGQRQTSSDPQPTCDHHGSFGLYIFLFPGALIEFLLPERHLIGFYVPPLRVLGGENGFVLRKGEPWAGEGA